MPVRDALKILEGEGLIQQHPHTWATVREFTASDLADLDEVRAVLDPLAFRLAAARHHREGLARLRECLDLQESRAAAGDMVVAHRAAADFHEIVTELADNRLLGDMMRGIRSRMRWALSQHDDLTYMSVEHAELFTAIQFRDADRAAELAARHQQASVWVRAARTES